MHSRVALYYGLFVLCTNLVLMGCCAYLVCRSEDPGGFEQVLSVLSGFIFMADFILVGLGAVFMVWASVATILNVSSKQDTRWGLLRVFAGSLMFVLGSSVWVLIVASTPA